MSVPSSPSPEQTGPPKKSVSPVRHAVGVVVLIAVLAVLYFEYTARTAFSTAVGALNARIEDEEKNLATVQEAESMLGKQADGPATDAVFNNQTFATKTYTWRGLLKSYTLVAFYTKGADPGLHHIESEGAKLAEDPKPPPVVPSKSDGFRLANTKKSSTPPKKGTNSGPAKAATDSAPAKTTTDSAPAKTSTDSAPAKTSTNSAPAKNNTDPAPAKPSTDPAPAKNPG
jgi:hypothetical protein